MDEKDAGGQRAHTNTLIEREREREIQKKKEVKKAQWHVGPPCLPDAVADITTLTDILNFELDSKFDDVFTTISSVYKIENDKKNFGKKISKDALYGATLNDGTEKEIEEFLEISKN